MNCREVIDLLDNQKIERLDSLQQQQVQMHVAMCTDCARAWRAQSSLAALPDMDMPSDLLAHCRAAVAGRNGGADARRASRRAILWGALATVAAAAAVLVLQSESIVRRLSGPEVQVLHGGDAPFTIDAGHSDVPTNLGEAASLSIEEPVALLDADAGMRFSVRVVLPDSLRTDLKESGEVANDPATREVLESLAAALMTELRNVPELTVVDVDPGEITRTSSHYWVRIAPGVMLGIDGKAMKWDRQYFISFAAEQVRPDGTHVSRLVGGTMVDPLANCIARPAGSADPCPDNVPNTAAALVRQLQQKVFPPGAAITRPLQAQVGNSSLAPEERFDAFVELFRQQAKLEGKALFSDRAVVRSAIELAQLMDAGHRAQLWRAMRGVGNTLLVEPLLASLQQDVEEVRVAVLETLAADFSGDQRVRAALETAAMSDPRPLVRAVARRGLTGNAGWREYVASSLKNPALPDHERVEALLYELYPPDTIEGFPAPSPADYWQILKDMDDASVRSLTQIFPRAEVFRGPPSENLLGNFSFVHGQNPAVTEMLLAVLQHDTRASNRAVAGRALAEMHAREPRVREALLEALAMDPDPLVRNSLGQILQRDSLKGARESAGR